jgi:hypothetical protein
MLDVAVAEIRLQGAGMSRESLQLAAIRHKRPRRAYSAMTGWPMKRAGLFHALGLSLVRSKQLENIPSIATLLRR